MSRPVFELALTAGPEHIDELGHVNNAVWVQWIQQVAVAHWDAVADAAHKDAYYWVVVRHEIDYLRAAFEATGSRRGPGSTRRRRARGPTGHGVHRAGRKALRAGENHWAIIDKASGRPIRVPPEVMAPFMAEV